MVQAVNDAGDVKAYLDPAKAINNRPCLLVAPPRVDRNAGTMTGPSITWRVIALSSYDAGNFEAFAELEALIDAASDVLDVETAEPAQYQFNTSIPRVAAYICTVVTFA